MNSDQLIEELCLQLKKEKNWETLCKLQDIKYKILEERLDDVIGDR